MVNTKKQMFGVQIPIEASEKIVFDLQGSILKVLNIPYHCFNWQVRVYSLIAEKVTINKFPHNYLQLGGLTKVSIFRTLV